MTSLLQRDSVAGRRAYSFADHPLVPWLVALVAAAPTVVAARHAGFVSDDWVFASHAKADGWAWWTDGLDIKFRPIQAAYHGVTFDIFGAHPTPHMLLLAGLQAIAGALIVMVGRRFVPPTAALTVGLVWAVVPTRGASRFWVSAAPITISVILLLVGALAAASGYRYRWWATLACCAAVLTYEAGVAIGLIIVIAAFHTESVTALPDRFRAALPGLTPYLIVVAWNLLTSPKSPGSAVGDPLASIDALVGRGISPEQAPWLCVAVLAVVTFGAFLGLRTLTTRTATTHLLVSGAAFAAAGVAPMLITGIPISISGPGDRVGTFAAIGVSILLAGGLWPLAILRPPVGTAVVITALLVMSIAGLDDLTDVQAAQRDAVAVIDGFDALPDHLTDQRLVLAPTTNHGGWIGFGFSSISNAARLHGYNLDIRGPRYELGPIEPDETVVTLDDRRLVAW